MRDSRWKEDSTPARGRESGMILIFTLLMLLGISVIAVAMMHNAKHGEMTALNLKNRISAFYAADGIRAMLAQEVVEGKAKPYLDTSEAGAIRGRAWDGLGGDEVAHLRSAIGGLPGRAVESDYLGSNWKYASNYGVQWTGYVIPPANGAYTFYLRCDDACEFRLSTDEDSANLPGPPLAALQNSLGIWPTGGPGVSRQVVLKVGKRYFFEFLHKQAGHRGVGQVGWKGPNFLLEKPIPGKRLASAGSKGKKWDTASIDGAKVRYALAQVGPLIYSINAEAILGGIGDTSFRSAQQQILNLRGDNLAPPESLWQRVIFYDMHSDRSHPEFERGDPDFGAGLATRNMVRTKGLQYTTENADFFGMDSIGKPMRGTTPKWNCGVTRWFTPWRPGWFRTYAYAGGQTDCAETAVGHDTAFKNLVIKDSILFRRRDDLGANAYEFKDSSTSSIGMDFDPLGGRGFGNEYAWAPNNFSFCMEMHSLFEHTSGITFEFDGDDDVWLYINDSLVLDLGFVHPSKYEVVDLDDLPLKYGETYSLDFFYCERQSAGSSINLITNLPVLQVVDKPRSSWQRDYGELD